MSEPVATFRPNRDEVYYYILQSDLSKLASYAGGDGLESDFKYYSLDPKWSGYVFASAADIVGAEDDWLFENEIDFNTTVFAESNQYLALIPS